MRAHKYILTIVLLGILCSATTDEKQYTEYQGGRFGYSGATIKLYTDSTYHYFEWNHTGSSIKDSGKWGKMNQSYYLSSLSKTRWKHRNEKSDSAYAVYHFKMQEFSIDVDTLKFLPKDDKDKHYYNEYYKFYKVKSKK